MNSKDFKNENPGAAFFRPMLFSIRTHEINIKKRKKKITYKLKMVFQHKKYEFQLQKEYIYNEFKGIQKWKPDCYILRIPAIFYS